MEKILELHELSKSFKLSKKQQELRNLKEPYIMANDSISFTSYSGEVFGLLGPNGAGKTTTMRMLATLINPDSGDALVNGHSITKAPDMVRRSIGFLTNELKLDDYFTPNFIFDFFAKMHNLEKDIANNRKKELFEKFGIDRYAEVKIANLSQGNKQKISLAVSILHDPKVVIFDEPTNGLDVITSKVVTDFLVDLKSQGKSIILSSHIFELLEELCDRVGIIISGKMAACDTVANLAGEQTLKKTFFDIYNKTTREMV